MLRARQCQRLSTRCGIPCCTGIDVLLPPGPRAESYPAPRGPEGRDPSSRPDGRGRYSQPGGQHGPPGAQRALSARPSAPASTSGSRLISTTSAGSQSGLNPGRAAHADLVARAHLARSLAGSSDHPRLRRAFDHRSLAPAAGPAHDRRVANRVRDAPRARALPLHWDGSGRRPAPRGRRPARRPSRREPGRARRRRRRPERRRSVGVHGTGCSEFGMFDRARRLTPLCQLSAHGPSLHPLIRPAGQTRVPAGQVRRGVIDEVKRLGRAAEQRLGPGPCPNSMHRPVDITPDGQVSGPWPRPTVVLVGHRDNVADAQRLRPSDRSSLGGVGAQQVGVRVLRDHADAGTDRLGRDPGSDVHLEPAVIGSAARHRRDQARRAVLYHD